MHRWEGLEEVVAIADAGTFAGAAKVLHVSTSHVSKVVARLEERLQTQLFHRTTRRVSLTDTGYSFVEHSRRIIQARDELISMVNGSDEPQGELRITCPISIGERFVEPIVRQFMEAWPRLSVTLDLTNRVVDLLGEGYHMAIRTGEISDPRLISREIALGHLETTAAPAYLAQAGIPACIEELKAHRCLIGTRTVWHFLEEGRPRIFMPEGRWRCTSVQALADAATAGLGVCQLPRYYVRQRIIDGLLRPVLVGYRAKPEPIRLVYLRRYLFSKVRNLADELAAKLQLALDTA